MFYTLCDQNILSVILRSSHFRIVYDCRHLTMPDTDLATTKTPAGSQTVLDSDASRGGTSAVLKLKLKKPRPSRRVQWTEDTVDNEHLNKKKSKCCCIYKKPVVFGESESEDSDSDCEHCSHHTPKDFVSSRHGADIANVEEEGGGEGLEDAGKGEEEGEGEEEKRLHLKGSVQEEVESENQSSVKSSLPVNTSQVIAESPRKTEKSEGRKGYPCSQLRNENYPVTSGTYCQHVTHQNTRQNGKINYSLLNFDQSLCIDPVAL